MRRLYKILLGILAFLLLCAAGVFFLAQKEVPSRITYGVSFNTLYAEELGLDPKETYLAILNELGVKHLRLAAHYQRRNWSGSEAELPRFQKDGPSAGWTARSGSGRSSIPYRSS